jgi:hypothetical protein
MPDSPSTNKPRPIRSYVLILLLAVCYLKIVLILTGVFDSGLGDGSSRIVIANRMAQTPGSWFSRDFWTGVWQFGPFISQGIFIRIFQWIGLAPHMDVVKFCLIQASILFCLGAWFLYLAAERLAGPLAGALVVLGLLGNEYVQLMSLSANAETYAFFYASIGIWLLTGQPLTRRAAAAAGVALLAAQLCRSEVAILSAMIGVALFFGRRFAHAFIFVGFAEAFVYIRPILVRIMGWQAVGWRDLAGKVYRSPESLADLMAVVLRAIVELLSSSYAPFLYVGLFGWVFVLRNRRLRAPALIAPLYPFCLIGALIVMSLTTWAPRYFYLAMVLLIFSAGILIARLVDTLRESPAPARRRLAAVLIAAAVILHAGLFTKIHLRHHDSSLSRYIRMPIGVGHARDWLDARVTPDDGILFDYLQSWDQYLHAQTERMDRPRPAMDYSSHPPLKPVPATVPPDADRATRTTVKFHSFIAQYRPRYFVLAGPRLLPRDDAQFRALHKRASYVRPYMTPADRPRTWIYRTPFIDDAPELRLTLEFGNEDVEIYSAEPIGADLVPNGAFADWDQDRPSHWRVLGGRVSRAVETSSLRIEPPAEGATQPALLRCDLPADPAMAGHHLRLRVRARGADPNQLAVTLIAILDGKDVPIASPQWVVHPGDGAWRDLEARALVPADARLSGLYLLVKLQPAARQAAFIDRIGVTPAAP